VKNFIAWLPQAARRPYFPILLLLVANLIAGLLTFQDYGLSWDEPLFYQYAQAVPYAYSISARLSGDFNLENAYGPSSDHKLYGPAYLLLAKPVVDLLGWALPLPRAELWHLVNFITFQIGVVFLYALCLRWMSSWAAFGAALFFSTQPVLWGHGWINPKDMPFTVFFLAAIYFGFKMVDALTDPTGGVRSSIEHMDTAGRWRKVRKIFQILALVFLALALVSFVFSAQLQGMLRDLIHNAYQSAPHSLLGKLFGWLAANARTVPEEAYVNKGLVLFARMRIALVAFTLVFLLPAILLTFWMSLIQRFAAWLADALAPLPAKPAWWWNRLGSQGVLLKTLLAGIFLGLVASIRVLGPLAGVLVCLYFFFKHERRSFAGLVVYVIVALLAMYFAWPYLWDAPLSRFIEVLRIMSHNPQIIPVLFNGVVYPSDGLPVTYLPVMLAITMTWPVWLLFIISLAVFWLKFRHKTIDWRSLFPVLLWFLVPFTYVLLLRPPLYDGYRHFLFMLPAAFILIGLAFQAALERLRYAWGYALVLTVLVLPGVLGLVTLHPYQYAYYNPLVGGIGGAFRHYETDFWLTCYKELMAQVDEQVAPGTTIFVHRQPSIAQEYASPGITIERFDPDDDRAFPGSLLLLTTRANVDQSLYPDAPELFSVGRDGAVFCLVREIP
jgi:hypothetical protein